MAFQLNRKLHQFRVLYKSKCQMLWNNVPRTYMRIYHNKWKHTIVIASRYFTIKVFSFHIKYNISTDTCINIQAGDTSGSTFYTDLERQSFCLNHGNTFACFTGNFDGCCKVNVWAIACWAAQIDYKLVGRRICSNNVPQLRIKDAKHTLNSPLSSSTLSMPLRQCFTIVTLQLFRTKFEYTIYYLLGVYDLGGRWGMRFSPLGKWHIQLLY